MNSVHLSLQCWFLRSDWLENLASLLIMVLTAFSIESMDAFLIVPMPVLHAGAKLSGLRRDLIRCWSWIVAAKLFTLSWAAVSFVYKSLRLLPPLRLTLEQRTSLCIRREPERSTYCFPSFCPQCSHWGFLGLFKVSFIFPQNGPWSLIFRDL